MSLVRPTRSISSSNLLGMLSIAPVVAADTVTGSSVRTMQHSSRILSIRFFIGFSPPVLAGPPRLFSGFLCF